MKSEGVSAEDLFLKLRDIHVAQHNWAWLQSFLLAVLLISLILILRWYLLGKHRRRALQALKAYEKNWQDAEINSARFAALITTVVRNLSLLYYPRQQIAGLHGKKFIDFLNNSSKKKLNFSTYEYELCILPYMASSNRDLTLFLSNIRLWIKEQRGKNV